MQETVHTFRAKATLDMFYQLIQSNRYITKQTSKGLKETGKHRMVINTEVKEGDCGMKCLKFTSVPGRKKTPPFETSRVNIAAERQNQMTAASD